MRPKRTSRKFAGKEETFFKGSVSVKIHVVTRSLQCQLILGFLELANTSAQWENKPQIFFVALDLKVKTQKEKLHNTYLF